MLALKKCSTFALMLGVVASIVSVSAATETASSQPWRVLTLADTPDDRPAVATAVTLSGDGSTVAAGGDDHVIRVWDLNTGIERTQLRGHDDWVRAVRLDPKGERLASVGNDQTLRVWTANRDTLTNSVLAKRLPADQLASVAFHPNGEQIFAAGFGTALQVYNVQTSAIDASYSCPCQDMRCVSVAPNGEWAAAAGRNGRLRIWNLKTGEAGDDVPADIRRIHAVAFSPDSQTVATGGDGRVIRIWRASDGELIAELPTERTKVRSMVYLNRQQIAVGGVDNTIRIWSISSRMPVRELIGHTGCVAALATDDAGTTLASASYDTTVRVWRLEEPAPETAALDSNSEALR